MKEQVGFYLKVLNLIGRLIPGESLKTTVYLSCLAKPRKFLRKIIYGFYRMEHIYEVLKEFKSHYKGKFSILEFGVADGYSFIKHLHATRYLRMTEQVMVHGFDSFEGLPEANCAAEQSLVIGDRYLEGHYRGRYEELLDYCRAYYSNFALHKGLFEDTITEEFLNTLKEYLPILIWIDCDYYTSTKTVFKRLIPYIPTGCAIYFDDIYYNFGSRFTGEMKMVWEINQGFFGKEIELVPDRELTLDSNRVYRFINLKAKVQHKLRHPRSTDPVRRRRDGSPFP